MTPTDPPPPPSASAKPASPGRDHPVSAGQAPHSAMFDGVPEHPADDPLHNEDVAHEHSDVNVRAVIIAAIALAGVTAFAFLAMWGVFAVLEHRAAANDPQLPPTAVPAGQLPPAPRLLTNEPQALEALRASERQALEHYGWTDRSAGTVHIPIAEAKKMILQRGFTVRPDGPVDPSLGTNGPARGESSSGRAIPVLRMAKPAAPPDTPSEVPRAEVKKEG